MDCFAGSGTTLAAAYELERNWIGVDNSPESLRAVLKRFTDGLEMYGDYVNKSEYVQESFDLERKCEFTIFTTNEKMEFVQSIANESNLNNE